VAHFSLRARRAKGKARAARRGAMRVTVNARRSHDPDGRIVRYRWHVSGKRRAICTKRRCSLKLRPARRRMLKLVVTDGHGARASRSRRLPSR